MSRLGGVRIVIILAALFGAGMAPAQAGDMMDEATWMVVETVELAGHSPRHLVNLYDQGHIDAIGLRPLGGNAFCYTIEIRMADRRRSFARSRSLTQGEVAEFEMWGTNTRVQSVVFSCHPRFGATTLDFEILVR